MLESAESFNATVPQWPLLCARTILHFLHG